MPRDKLRANWSTSPDSIQRLEALAIASCNHGVTLVDVNHPELPLIYINAAFTDITGYSASEVLGRNCRFLQGQGTDPQRTKQLRAAIMTGQPCQLILKNYRKNGMPFWNEISLTPLFDKAGRLSHYLGVQRDVTQRQETEDALVAAQASLKKTNKELEARVEERTRQLAEANARLRHDAFHDSLTGLGNRVLLHERLAHALERQAREGTSFSVLYLDFDRFKIINDSLGHSFGDALLKQAGRRLTACLRPADTVARLGGDEFAILLEAPNSAADAQRSAERILHSINKPFRLGTHDVHISTSIGIVTSDPLRQPRYGSSEALLRDADIAMYRAKHLGKARAVTFDAPMREHAHGLMALEQDLKAALIRNELRVHYQPIIAAQSGQTIGFEALARWHHPRLGILAPMDFLQIAEETGMIVDIDRIVLRVACQEMMAWQTCSTPTLSLSVNLSGQHVSSGQLLNDVKAVLLETNFSPALLRLELTENVIVDASQTIQNSLKDLRQLGIELHIDDFGTGYSSLSYLQRLPSSTVKIDRSFVADLTRSKEGKALVRAIINLAHTLDKKVIAEGIEDAAQLDLLQQMRCDYVQGYLFAKPLQHNHVAAYLRSSSHKLPDTKR